MIEDPLPNPSSRPSSPNSNGQKGGQKGGPKDGQATPGNKKTGTLPPKITLDISTPDQTWLEAVPSLEALLHEVTEEVLKTPEARGRFEIAPAARIGIGFCFADDAFVAGLNKEFRGQSKPTNVLSFPSGEVFDGIFHLGEITLASGVVAREAVERQKPVLEHTTHLVIHGLLHLLGFDHETGDEAALMEAIEIKVMQQFGFGNPYILPEIKTGTK